MSVLVQMARLSAVTTYIDLGEVVVRAGLARIEGTDFGDHRTVLAGLFGQDVGPLTSVMVAEDDDPGTGRRRRARHHAASPVTTPRPAAFPMSSSILACTFSKP